MEKFASLTIPELIFGSGCFNKLFDIFKSREYKNIVIISGTKSLVISAHWKMLVKFLTNADIAYFHYQSSGETSPEVVDGIVQDLKGKNVDVVLAVGGGTVLDTGKAVSAMLCMDGSIVDYLEGVGSKHPTGNRKPLICVPTTSGTGSEATKNAVITKTGINGFKKSLRHKGYIPDLVLIDPELIQNCPKSVTIATGLDAITQLLESYVSSESSPFTDNLALYGLRLAGRSLPKLVEDLKNMAAREEMAYAAYLSGITLANAGLGVIHGAASVLGGLRPIPHGVVCGTLLASVTEMIIKKLTASENPEKQIYIRKYAEAGNALSSTKSISYMDDCNSLVVLLKGWIKDFNIPILSEYAFTREEIIKCSKITGLKNTPVKLCSDDIEIVLLSRL
jgi:alcohol dehydrogenase class IV